MSGDQSSFIEAEDTR